MNILDNTIMKVLIYTSIYIFFLVIFSPLIDHIFFEFNEIEKKTQKKIFIISEIILQITILSLLWYLLNKNIIKYMTKYISISGEVLMAIRMITNLALFGLQKNLIDKLEYITLEHPIRITK